MVVKVEKNAGVYRRVFVCLYERHTRDYERQVHCLNQDLRDIFWIFGMAGSGSLV